MGLDTARTALADTRAVPGETARNPSSRSAIFPRGMATSVGSPSSGPSTVNANDWEPGYVNSVVGAAQFTILPAVFFTSPGAFSNGVFQMTVAGFAGSNYVLQVSSNLTQWSSIATNTPATSPFKLSDPTAPGGSARFYRVLQQP